MFRITSAIDNAMRAFFFRLGYMVAGRPILTIVVMVVLTLLCLIGMIRFHTESRPEELWVPQGTVALDNMEYVEERFGESIRSSSIAFVAQKEGENVATKTAMLDMIKVAQTGFNVVADSDGTQVNFPERCVKTADTAGNRLCLTSSPFDLFYDTALVQKTASGLVDYFATVRAKIEGMTDAQIQQKLENGPFQTFSGTPLNIEDVVGGQSGSGSSFSVKSMRYSQFAEGNSTVSDGESVDSQNDDWEEAWTKKLLDDRSALNANSINWFVESTFSQSESLSEALSGDLPLFSIGFALLAGYIVLFLGDFHAVRSRHVLGLVALLNAGLSLGATFGLASAFGMFFGPVHQVLPLLIIGIGVDDVFVVTRALDDINYSGKYNDKPARTRVALALSNAGTAITVTSFTNTIVFLFGAISKLPALRFFAIWAAIGVFLDWVYTITFYTAALLLDTRRQDAKRRDCFPCCRPVQEVKELNWFKRSPGGFSRFFKDQFGPFIMNKYVRIIILALFLALFGVCIWGCTQLYLKFRFAFFYPAGSDQREYQDIVDKYYKIGLPARIYVGQTDISTPENQLRYIELCHPTNGVIAKNEFVQNDTVDCWFHAFRESKGISGIQVTPRSTFNSEVRAFIESAEGRKYDRDVVFTDSGAIDASRFEGLKVYAESNNDEIDALESLRADADSVGFGEDSLGNPRAFPYIFQDTFTEQYIALPREIGISLGLASVAVAIVCFLMVGHPIVALVSVIIVGMVIIDVLGFTFFTGVNLNSVSVITIVIATGIAVDYVVHVARGFLEQVGTRNERAIRALGALGPPVFYAGFSTFLAIIVLAFASSYIFNVLFKGFIELITIGLGHGLILGPVVLSLIGPASFYASEDEKEAAEAQLEEKIVGKDGRETVNGVADGVAANGAIAQDV